jgi:hypothetical protein
MIKLTKKNYKFIVKKNRYEWKTYATQILNIAASNSKALRPKNVGPVVDMFKTMRENGIPGTLKNWEKYYNKTQGKNKIIDAGKKIYQMICKMQIGGIDEQMCINYAEEVIYNKTHMGCAGQEIAIEVVSKYLNKKVRWPTPEEDSAKGIDAWIGNVPVQVKPHGTNFKSHIFNNPNKDTHLIISYEIKKSVCYIHNLEIIKKYN